MVFRSITKSKIVSQVFLTIILLATSSLSEAAMNRPPTANSQNLVADEDTHLNITLTGSDPEGADLTYSIFTNPTQGVLTGSGSTWTYTPTANINGSDSFKFRVNDGNFYSRLATVSITINAVNDAPTVDNTSLEVSAGSSGVVTVTGSDVEGSALSFSIVDGPSHGEASLVGSTLTYTSTDRRYSGGDSVTFTASDGVNQSTVGTVSITVLAYDTVVGIDNADLELIDTVTTSVSGDRTTVTMTSNSCYNFAATPLVLPGTDNEEYVVGTLHSICSGYADVENYTFFVDTANGKTYRPTSDVEIGMEPDSAATLTYDAPTGMLFGGLSGTAYYELEPYDAEEPVGGFMVFQDGVSEYWDFFASRRIEVSTLMVNGVIPIGTTNDKAPTCQNGSKIDAEKCGVWGLIDSNTGTLIDSSMGNVDYNEMSPTAAMTHAIVTEGGDVSYDRLAFGTGIGGNNSDATPAGCTAFLLNTNDFLDAGYNGDLVDFGFLEMSYDPGSTGCLKNNAVATSYSSIQGEMTVGFNPVTQRPTYWAKGYMPDDGSENTRITQLDENLEPICDVLVNSGANRNPFNGGSNGMVIDRNGNAYTNVTYRDSSGVQRMGIWAINPADCSTDKLVELNYSAMGNSSFSGITLGVDADGNDVVLGVVAGNLFVVEISSGNYTTYALGSTASDNVMASPVIDGAGRVIVMSKSNVMTIFNNMNMSYGDHFWPRFRQNNYGTGTVEMMQ